MNIKFNNKYIKWGLTAFVSAGATILLYFILYRSKSFVASIDGITGILMPFIYGLVIAYLLCPLYNFFTRKTLKCIKPIVRHEKSIMTVARFVSTTLTLLVAMAVIAGLLSMVIPQTFESILRIVANAPETFNSLVNWTTNVFKDNPSLNQAATMLVGDVSTKINEWIQTTAMPYLLTLMAGISTGIFGVINFLKNMLIGIIICVYFLNSKEIFAAQVKKILYSVFSTEKVNTIIEETAFINKTFSGFISGKLVDSAIIGVICFVCMSILNLPYVMLISVIIGVTNIIPFFGPFIGAIPSAIIILTVDPMQCVYFVIFVLILQQVDGNIIGPKILGDSTGLPSFWVMFAILVGGGLFGFVGMIIGIPFFAVIYAFVGRYVKRRLKDKNLPVDTDKYKDLTKYEEVKVEKSDNL